MYKCPDTNDVCVECSADKALGVEQCEHYNVLEGQSPCKPGECIRDGACYQYEDVKEDKQ